MGRYPKWLFFCLQLAGFVVFAPLSLASSFSVNITVDENCHGTLTNTSGYFGNLPCSMMADPGPGGLSNVMTYDLLNPPGLVAGDVLIHEGGIGGNVFDVIRFNPGLDGGGSLVIYSDNIGGFDSGADTSGPPTGYYPNTIDIVELGDEINNGARYTPLPGQPGFVTGAGGPVTYYFIGDGAGLVPEPGSILLMASGVALLGLYRIRRCGRNSRT